MPSKSIPHHGGVLHLFGDLTRSRGQGSDPNASDGQIQEPEAVREDLVNRGDDGVDRVHRLGIRPRNGHIQFGKRGDHPNGTA